MKYEKKSKSIRVNAKGFLQADAKRKNPKQRIKNAPAKKREREKITNITKSL